jgi:iduronate 2-sulfatase
MNHLQTISLGLLATVAMPATAADKTPQPHKPNILFIAIDDLKPVLGSYGNPLIKTPMLDQIANNGTVFLN